MHHAAFLVASICGLSALLPGPASAQPLPAARHASKLADARIVTPSGVRNAVFIAHRASGWRQYTPRHVPLFKAGETLQFYAEPVNLGWSLQGTAFRFEVHVDVEIRSLEGQVLWGQKNFGRQTHESPAIDPNTYITGAVAVTGLQPGRYVLSIRLRDPSNGQIAETELPFGIVAEPRWIDA